MSQTIIRSPERHDEQPPENQPRQHQPHPALATEWVDLYHREGVPVRSDEHPVGDADPQDWGWHGEMGKWGRRLWVLPFALMVAYLVTAIQRSEGDAAIAWLIVISALMLLFVVVDWRRRKNAWRSR